MGYGMTGASCLLVYNLNASKMQGYVFSEIPHYLLPSSSRRSESFHTLNMSEIDQSIQVFSDFNYILIT